MVVKAQAPCRISLFGSGCDLPSFKETGVIINLAINLRSEVTLFTEGDIFKAKNELPHKATPDLFYAILNELGLGGMHASRFISKSDAFVGEGLGTSGSAGVALVCAISKYKGLDIPRDLIAETAFKIESKLHNTGRQDVYASAFGGMNTFIFSDETLVAPIDRDTAENIKKHLFLFYVGGDRKPQVKGLSNLREIKRIAIEAGKSLDDVEKLGNLLHKSWLLKKKSNKNVSNKRIDSIYKEGRQAGAWGGKILGSGGGGYFVFLSEKKPKIDLEEVDFEIDYQGVESRIL